MKEVDNILQKMSKENAFHTPEGYFENLTSQIMSRIPEEEMTLHPAKRVSKWHKLRIWGYVAAGLVTAALIIRVFSADHSVESGRVGMEESSEKEFKTDRYVSTAMDNSMMDDYSLYVYLTDNAQ